MLGGEKQKVTLMFDLDILSEIFDSFLSYSRYGYFRRILCNMLGGMSDRGEITADTDLIGRTVKDICYANAVRYFGEEK